MKLQKAEYFSEILNDNYKYLPQKLEKFRNSSKNAKNYKFCINRKKL